MGRHGDDDLDGTVNQGDDDWLPPDRRDEHAIDDAACDPTQEQPARWVGVTRDPDRLPVAPADAETPDG